VSEKKEKPFTKSQPQKKVKEPEIKVDQFTINNLAIKFQNKLRNRESSLKVKYLNSDFDYLGTEANLNLQVSVLIEKLQLTDNYYLTDKSLNLDLNSHLRDKNKVEIEKGRLEFENAIFDIDGYYDFENQGEISVNFEGSDHKLSFFSQIFKIEELESIKSGDFYFDGSVKGKTFVEFPKIKCKFGFEDVEIVNPVTSRRINNIDFKGSFNSGQKKDFSDSKLRIDTLNADFHTGTLKLSGVINNFVTPELDVNLFLKANVTGFDEVLKLGFIDDLKGNIDFRDRFKGKFNSEENRFLGDINISLVSFKDFGFVLPGALRIDKLNGKIFRVNDDYFLDSLSVISEDTDLLLNGKINNLHYLWLNIEKDLNADLTVKSKIFDLPNFLFFDPSIKRDFPYRIVDVDLKVEANTSTTKILNFKSFPEIRFKLKHLDATTEDFLPPIVINSGEFEINENLLGFHLHFEKFQTDFIDGKLNFTADYNSSKHQPYYTKGDFNFSDINLSKLFGGDQNNTAEFFKGSLNGSFFAELQFPTDTMEIKLLDIKRGNLNYYFGDDTIQTTALRVFTEDVYFDAERNSNPLATLTTDILIKTAELYTNHFIVDDVHYDINADHGTYTVIPKEKSFFGSEGQGKYLLKPFDEIPNYKIQYSIDNFNAEDLLTTFLEDTILTGKMDFSMDIAMSGKEWDSLVSKLNGDIHLVGKDLIFYGVDVDEMLEKFKRSQNFNLIDVGAVLLAGPVGIAVTKGTDYASLIVLNSGEETTVKNLISDWSINDGKLIIEDVAFTTTKNRIAADGWISFTTDSIDLTIALIDKNGCSLFSQDLYGSFDEPQKGDIKVVGTILAPITNLVDDVFGADCEVFYNGSLVHPNQ
jgi:hypothetical protein